MEHMEAFKGFVLFVLVNVFLFFGVTRASHIIYPWANWILALLKRNKFCFSRVTTRWHHTQWAERVK